MNILIDTNILIPLEDTSRLLDRDFANIKRISTELGFRLYIHPAQKDDISRDKDESRRDIVLSRINQYPQIPNPPILSEADLNDYGWKQSSDNDRVDNLLLHALARGACNLLVTNDLEIHKKAERSSLHEKVYRHEQLLEFLTRETGFTSLPPSGVKEKYLHEFNVKSSFFDSLRDGYKEFDDWFIEKAREQRQAWCILDSNNNLQAICIYKEEISPVISDDGKTIEGKTLKLCTFKVGETIRGRKIGERLLYTAFKYAIENHYNWVYLHTYGFEHELLVSLCLDYGFECVGRYKERDDVYLKPMVPDYSSEIKAIEFAKRYYPGFRDNEDIKKFIVPIRPEYHNDLFPDISDDSTGLFKDDPTSFSPQSNTIKKAYICHSNTKQIEEGSILLFYRTIDRKSIECIGVVEQVFRSNDVGEVAPIVSKRTVYNLKDLNEMLTNEALIVLFRLMKYISPIDYKKLQKKEIKGPYQSIRELPHELYKRIFEES